MDHLDGHFGFAPDISCVERQRKGRGRITARVVPIQLHLKFFSHLVIQFNSNTEDLHADHGQYCGRVALVAMFCDQPELTKVVGQSGSTGSGLCELQSISPRIIGVKTSDTAQCFVPDATDSFLL